MDIVEIGRRLRHARQRQRLTQAEVADRSGISRTTYTRLELGRLPEIGFEKLCAILDVVGMRLSLDVGSADPKPIAPSLAQLVDASKNDPKQRVRTQRQLRDIERLILAPSGLSANGIAKIMTTLKGKAVAASTRAGNAASDQKAVNEPTPKPTLNDMLNQRALERRDRSAASRSQ